MNNFTSKLNRLFKNPAVGCYLLIFTTLYAEYLFFIFSIGGMGAKWYVTCAKCLGDISFVTLFYWFIPNRKKWIYLIVQTLLSIFFLANIWYFRAWNDLLSPISYKLGGNVNRMLLDSLTGLVRASDILYVILAFISFFFYFKIYKPRLKSCTTLPFSIKSLLAGICLIIFVLSQAAFIVTSMHLHHDAWGDEQPALSTEILNRLNPGGDIPSRWGLQQEGLVIYLSRAIWMVTDDLFFTRSHIDLSPSDIREIDDYLESAVPAVSIPEFARNKDKNLVLILVESLNSYVIGKTINGHEVTPNLNALAKADGSITALNVHSQIKDGISHDGQLIINTGLLPIDKGVAMMEYGARDYTPSLPRILPARSSAVIFADNGRNYRKSDAFKALGFDTVVRNDAFIAECKLIGRDKAMFNYTQSLLQTDSSSSIPHSKILQTPFFLELHTISSHAPFQEKGVATPSWLAEAKQLELHERNYFTTINYFDNALGAFIRKLKESGIWDSTILVVVADHSFAPAMGHLDNPEKIQLDYTEIPCVFIAANTGVTKQISTPVGQVNIFPTILQIMDALPQKGYRGLGRSMLDPDLKSALDSRDITWGEIDPKEEARLQDAFRISNLIHRGDYFGRTSAKAAHEPTDTVRNLKEPETHR